MKRLLLLATFACCALPSFAQWTPLNSGTTANLNDIYFTNATTGYAGGAGGVLIKTTNGGNSWTRLPTFTSDNITEVYFSSSDTGWIATEGRDAFRTVDGGATFQSLEPLFGITDTSLHLSVTGFNFDGKSGLITGSFTNVPQTIPMQYITKSTTDGGITWRDFLRENKPALGLVRIISPDTIFQAPFGALLKTTDGGINWDTVCTNFSFPPLNNRCFNIFDGKGNGLASMQYHYEFGIFEPLAGGVSFKPDSIGLFGVFSMSFPEGKTGYLLKFNFVGAATPRSILKTQDGGRSFKELTVPDSFSAENLYFVTEALGFICGANGAIYKTTNGGGTLAIADPSKNQPTVSVFPNPATEHFTIPQSVLPFSKAELFSTDGKKVKTISAGTTTVDVRELPAGQYLLLLQRGSKTETVKVLVHAL